MGGNADVPARLRRGSIRIVFPIACAALVFAFSGVVPPPAQASGPTIVGAGASFPQLEIEQWRADVAHKPYQINVNYVSAGSTFGREQYIAGLVDFGVSDIAFQGPELDRLGSKRPFVYVPVSAGGVGFMYNLRDTSGRRITTLKMTQRTICRVFSERGMYWDDAEIKGLNPGLGLRHQPVVPVLRADGAGTSYVLSEFCIADAPDVWRSFINYVATDQVLHDGADPFFLNGEPTSRWPPFGGIGQFASDGVANAVANPATGDGAMTYVEAGFAYVRGFPVASVKNTGGRFTLPTASNVNRALAYAHSAGNGTLTLAYKAPDPNVYFPSSYSYVIAQTKGLDPNKGRVLGTFLNYSLTKGQDRAEPLGYARLSSVIVNAALNNVQKIPGAPPRPTQINAPPPPAIIKGPVVTTPRVVRPVTTGPAAITGPAAPGAGPATSILAQPTPTLQAWEAAGTTRGPTGREALWTMAQGAALCALGIAMVRGLASRTGR